MNLYIKRNGKHIIWRFEMCVNNFFFSRYISNVITTHMFYNIYVIVISIFIVVLFINEMREIFIEILLIKINKTGQ